MRRQDGSVDRGVEVNGEERTDGMARVLEMQLSRGIETLVNEIVVDKIMEILGAPWGGRCR